MAAPEHRLVVVAPLAPAAAFAAFRAWWRANVVQPGDADDDPQGWPTLNPAGDASAASHVWWSGALPDAVLRAVVLKACQLGSVTPPPTQVWAGWDHAAKVAWLGSVRSAIRAACGIHLDLCRQDRPWNSPDDVLAAVKLKRQSAPAVAKTPGVK